MKKFCIECGDEFEVNPNNKRSKNKKFCSGLCAKTNNGKNNKGKSRSEEAKNKISLANSGENNPFYGKKHSDEFKQKMSKLNLGKKFSEEINKKKGRSGKLNGFYGGKHTPETKAIISETHRDCSGKNNPMYGKGYKISGYKNGSWCGGISENLYGPEFNKTLKNEIRERDNFKCAICGKPGYDVHHINYDKNNNLKENLITLCHPDHMKTNFNREHWKKYFKSYMINEYRY